MPAPDYRSAYLDALGITRWVRRDAPPVGSLGAGELGGAVSLLDDGGTEPDVAMLDWPGLREKVLGCQGCDLCGTRTQVVFGVGDESADWLIVGEAPGEQEDLQGEPFVGRAGLLLNNMLAAVGLSRETVFIANVIKCRPPGNRDPGPREIEACLGYLHRQIALIQPKMILVVGRVAAQTLLQSDAPVGRLRGQVHTYEDVPLVVTYHPAYLLRRPVEKRKSWEDLKLAMSVFGCSR